VETAYLVPIGVVEGAMLGLTLLGLSVYSVRPSVTQLGI
jgi:hypothetical protein